MEAKPKLFIGLTVVRGTNDKHLGSIDQRRPFGFLLFSDGMFSQKRKAAKHDREAAVNL